MVHTTRIGNLTPAFLNLGDYSLKNVLLMLECVLL